jgi:hypothetical protein
MAYCGIGDEIALIKLTRKKSPIPPGLARTVSIIVQGGTFGMGGDQTVTFADLPLPPRQNVDDLFAAETQVIQY